MSAHELWTSFAHWALVVALLAIGAPLVIGLCAFPLFDLLGRDRDDVRRPENATRRAKAREADDEPFEIEVNEPRE